MNKLKRKALEQIVIDYNRKYRSDLKKMNYKEREKYLNEYLPAEVRNWDDKQLEEAAAKWKTWDKR